MAKIENLVARIPDERLRNALGAEVKSLKKTKRFGLVFEEHLPETVRLPRLAVRKGEVVALKRESGDELWRVQSIHKGVATCGRTVEAPEGRHEEPKKFPVAELVVVRALNRSSAR